MKRLNQSLSEIFSKLSEVETTWRDDQSEKVINIWQEFPVKKSYRLQDVVKVLARNDFEASKTALRLFLAMPQDDFERELRSALGGKSPGVTSFKKKSRNLCQSSQEIGPDYSDEQYCGHAR